MALKPFFLRTLKLLNEKREQKKFDKIYIEISNICNLQCSFCPEVIRAKKLISLTLFQKIVTQAAPLTEQVCFHLMGDPLVHPELEQLIEITSRAGARINLVTNGVLLREKRESLLLHSAFRQVNFSLHSFFDNFPDKDPSHYLDRIFSFTEKAFELRPDLFINFRLWNLQEVKGRDSRNTEMLARIEKRFQVFVDREIDVRKQKSIRLKNKLYLHFDTEFVWPDFSLPILGTNGTCKALKNHIGILSDGTVVPCCLDKEGKIPLGNIESQSLIEILKDSRAQSLLKGFRERKLVDPLCQRCNFIKRFE